MAQINLLYQNECERAEENYKTLTFVSLSPDRYLNLGHLEKDLGVLPTIVPFDLHFVILLHLLTFIFVILSHY